MPEHQLRDHDGRLFCICDPEDTFESILEGVQHINQAIPGRS